MGLQINRNEKGEYKLTSTISGESYHPKKEWVSEDEAKKCLINNEFMRFIDKLIEIDMSFPNNYRVNDKMGDRQSDYNEWVLKASGSADVNEVFEDKVKEIYERLKLDIKLP